MESEAPILTSGKMRASILIVEDELSVAEAVAYTLRQNSFDVAVSIDAKTAIERFESTQPDLVILDLMLPDISGWDLLRIFRRRRDVPVILLTARREESDRIAGLEIGADDYITKPFSMRELVARVRTILRRHAAPVDEELSGDISLSGVRVDLDRHTVEVDCKPVYLSPKEFSLLVYLMTNAGRIRSREQILNAVWGDNDYLDPRTVSVHIRWLRQKVEIDADNPTRIITVRGVGYKFVEAI